MRLQKLEIKGFKSFANDTVIHFNESVTGIIGPNGSGKSNIVDAIRWVLGEQKTRELRLEKMSSVIFNGSKKRKPAGAAFVALTFENTRNLLPTEYQTVTISRTLFRTGESEYRINNVICRLKDITSMFMDTGVGSNSYAIIALSMVDDILNDHEQSRRRMLEQAAGISKYKARKVETLRKLGHTDADLNRVDDLLFEIENNMKSLEKQARKAKKYLDLKATYRELSLEWAVFQTHDLISRYKQTESKLNLEEDKLRAIEGQIRTIEVKTEQEKLLNVDKEKALTDRQRGLNEVANEIRTRENKVELLNQRLLFIAQSRTKLQERMRFNKGRAEQLEKDLLFYKKKLGEAESEKLTGEQLMRQAEQELNLIKQEHGNIKVDLDLYLVELQNLEKGIYELEKQKAINQSQIENLQNEIQRNLKIIADRSEETEQLKQAVKELKAEEERMAAAVHSMEMAEDKRLAEIVSREEEFQKENQELAAINRQLDAARNEYKLTKSMVDNLEGFPESIKYLSQLDDFGKQNPLVTDVITTQEKHRLAVENFLDSYLNYYVVPDMSQAMRALQLLRTNQKGKANFLILDQLKNNPYTTPEVPGFIRLVDLIECDDVYRPLKEFLFYKAYLVGDEGGQMPEHPDVEATIIGLSGSWSRKKFSLSGGSVGLFEGKRLGRKKNLDNLEKLIKKLEKEEERSIEKVKSLKDVLVQLKQTNQPAKIKEAKGHHQQISQRLVTMATRLENADTYRKELDDRNKQASEIIRGLESRNESMVLELNTRRQEEVEFRNRMESTDLSFRSAADALNAKSSAYNEKHIRFIQLQNTVKSLEQEIQFRQNQLMEAEKSLTTDQEAESQSVTEAAAITEELNGIQTELVTFYEDRKLRESSLTQAEQDYYATRGQINELDNEMRTLNKQRNEFQSQLNDLKDSYNNIRLELTSIGERLKVEFKATIQDIINKTPNPEVDQEALEAQVIRIRSRLDNYGEVNPMAVEAYNEMKERFDTIDQQRQDILKAKTDLLQTIDEIELTATQKFMEAFNQVRDHFIQVFRSLFTGDDTADLILEEPHRPLDSNIQIIAKPKGKRPQSINQLSGGEKTLTATALLFSLYLLKPAPFCIFDEVDAPLDDSNIEKFNRIIKKFSSDSQFIIVTHNKLTMAAVDVLYGVYMREQGVSAVAAVDFRSYSHETIMETVEN